MLIRTINQAYEEIKRNDPKSALTKNLLRKLVKDGTIPSVKSGNRQLISLEAVERYFNSIN